MKHDDLPERWVIKLKAYLHDLGVERDRLSAEEFHHHLKLTFEDGSFVFFHYAFYLLDEELKEIAVFTEHCGTTFFLPSGQTLNSLNLNGHRSESNSAETNSLR